MDFYPGEIELLVSLLANQYMRAKAEAHCQSSARVVVLLCAMNKK